MTDKINDTITIDELQSISLNILGEPASKANSRKLVHYNGMSRLIKSEKALTYSEAFKLQTKPLQTLMSGDLKVTMVIYYASRRPDLDESLILDLLQGVVYENDRQVKIKHIYWALDRENPRAHIIVDKIKEVYPNKNPRRSGEKRSTAKAF
jgi:Endodeoxyribonuclease RusA